MSKIPLLPVIEKGEIISFHPLFSSNIEFEIQNNRLIILGGNGMGKTTILQAIIYCIAGEYTKDYEDDTAKRWGKKYFNGRIENLNQAFIKVTFKLGKDLISLKRGFERKSILEFSLNGELISDNSHVAENNFEEYLIEKAGYNEITDFYFLVHKLCYLPETRPNLVWDIDNQVRLLMLLSSDIINERSFREKRAELKLFDTKIRHTNVDINKLTDAIEKHATQNEEDHESVLETSDNDLEKLLDDFEDILEEKKSLTKKHDKKRLEYVEISSQLEELQSDLRQAEEKFILENIQSFESKEVSLAIHKLLHRKICPACGDFSKELSESANKKVKDQKCPLCGTDQDIESDTDLDTIHSEVNELLSNKISFEKELSKLNDEISKAKSKELSLQSSLNEFRLKKPRLNIVGDVSENDLDELKDKLKKEKENKATYTLLFNDLSQEIEELYENFSSQVQNRVGVLADLFKAYATQFLGIDCGLSSINANAKFVELNLFVPKFDNKIRSNSSQCSEAQRFFLDIAFRMALIEFAHGLNNSNGSFVCETPENALDMTYIDNVATMFKRFSSRGHHFIVTSNIQKGGLAGFMLSDLEPRERPKSILNMLNKARLTAVQEASLGELEAQLEEIFS